MSQGMTAGGRSMDRSGGGAAIVSRQVVQEGHRLCCVRWLSSIWPSRSAVRGRGFPVVSRQRLPIEKCEAVPGAALSAPRLQRKSDARRD